MAETENCNWGTELFDQYNNLSAHTLRGIEFLEKYGSFVKDRATIECEYASKLRRLARHYQPKKKDDEDHQYSSCRAFQSLLNEINDMAGQHEVVSENLQTIVIKELQALVKDLRDERKKCLNEGAKLTMALTNQMECLYRAQKAYEKAHREAEKALDNYQKADADLHLSRAEVEKQKSNMSYKSQMCEAAKNEYADQLQRTNDLQRQHYRSGLPEVFRQLQELDEKRIRNIKNFMKSSVDIERGVFPIINKCLDGIVKAADTINEKSDSLLVVEKYKTGFPPPEDIVFEDLAKNGGESGVTPVIHSLQHIGKLRDTVKGTMSAKNVKKRAGIFNLFTSKVQNNYLDGKEDYSDLAPNQRKKKLAQKVEELQNKVAQETAARDGLMKMKGVYEANPALGDPMTVEGQLNECSHNLEKLQSELNRYQLLLEEAIKNYNQTNSPRINNTRRNHRNSGNSAVLEEESLSRSASDSSVTNPVNNHYKPSAAVPDVKNLNHVSSNSPESGLGTSHTSLPEVDSDQDQYDGGGPNYGDTEAEYYEADLLPALGVCRALYAFEATSEGSIKMAEHEELHLIEMDQGDGWTRVRRMTGQCEEGFVPTTYVETKLYS